MYLDRVKRRAQELEDLGIEIAQVEPASREDVDALEKKLGLRLPGAVRELYEWAGNGFGEFLGATGGIEVAAHLKKDFRANVREMLAADGLDASALDRPCIIIDLNYDGAFSFVHADEYDDPVVYAHAENHPLAPFCERLSDYLGLLVEQCAGVESIAVAGSDEEIEADIQHLLFSGEVKLERIPDEVFQFLELRSLNLACKGLVEVSPRVGEFAFLKRLDLARNSLGSLPAELTGLSDLEDLDVSENQLTTIIDFIETLPALRFCTIRRNAIDPNEIDRIRREFPRLELGL